MGHVRLGTLPTTKKWRQVVSLIAGGADVERIAAASADAAEHGFERASQDQGLAYAFWLLAQVPQAARQPNFSQRLRELGLTGLPTNPTLLEIVAAFTRAVDRHVRESGGRTDLGEMAQLAASETLASLAGRELQSLFGPTPVDVQRALAKLGTSDQFSIVARDFFSRLTHRSLDYFLSRELSKHVGPNKRFAAISDHSDFNAGWIGIVGKLRELSKSFRADGTARRFTRKSKSAETRRANLRMSRSRSFAPSCASGETRVAERLVLCG